MTGLSIRVIGGLAVATGDGRSVRITARKAQALLGCLALEPGKAHAREFVATLLWEDSDAELARASLRQALAALRKALPEGCADGLRSDANAVWLDPHSVATDVGQLREAWRGDALDVAPHDIPTEELLAGLDAKSLAFEQWLEQQRSAFRRQRIEVLERLAARCAATDDFEGLCRALERLLVLDPVNERAHRALMDALAKQGRWTDALRQYRLCRDILRRELDVATEPATDALQREILRRRRAHEPTATSDEEAMASEPPVAASAVSPALLRDAVVVCVRRAGRGDEFDVEHARAQDLDFARRVSEQVARFGGRADRIAAGEVIAVFGLEGTTGNEVERAVRAALALAAPADDVGQAAIVAGVDAGQVLPVGGADIFPLSGRVVGAARDLARGATPGEVLVSETLLDRLGDRFEHTSAAVAGTTAHRVELRRGERLAPARPFVGRRAELALLTQLLERVTGTSRGRVVVVRGEPGIGKSAIIDALARTASDRDVTPVLLRVFDFGQAALERPVPALVARLLGIEAGADPLARASAVESAVAAGRVQAEERAIVADLVGAQSDETGALANLDNASRERERTQTLHTLVRRAARSPLLIVVEDAHWAEPAELTALADLAAALAAHPVLLVFSVRADDDPLGAAWRARIRGCPMTTLDLAPLDHDECVELAAAHGAWSPQVLERCVDLAGGHPLFLEQLLRASASGEATLPGSVRALLLRRVERLDAGTQQALQAAAVLGHRFALDALCHVLGQPGFDVARLEHSGLVTVDGDDWRFAHALIRDAVYESLLGSTRRELHRRAAAWFGPRDAGLAADHLAAAGDAGASAAYVRAATEQLQACRLERALAQAERARALAREPRDHCAALAALGDVQLALGRAVEACDTFRQGIDLACDADARSHSWLGLARALRILDRHDEALAALDHAERDLPADDDRRQARLWTLRGNLHFPRGELDLCLEAHRRALYHARQAESLEDVIRAFGGLGDAHYQRGRMRSAHEEFRRCTELAEQNGLGALRLAYLPMLSSTAVYLARVQEAVDTGMQALQAARAERDRRAELLAHLVLATAELLRGEYRLSADHAAIVVEIARALGTRRFEAESLVLQGLGLVGQGEILRGRALLEEGAEAARAWCPSYCGAWALASLAAGVADMDEVRARQLLDDGARMLRNDCVSHSFLEFHASAMQVRSRWQDWDAVLAHAEALETYTSDEPLPWVNVLVASYRAMARAATTAGPVAGEALRDALGEALRLQFISLARQLEQAIRTDRSA